MERTEQVITQTKKWITEVVIGCNFCPFAAQVVKQQKVYYRVEESASLASSLTAVMAEAKRLDEDDSIDTTFIILPQSFEKFTDYLHLVSLAEELLKKNDYEGVYQLASFHPLYKFAGSTKDDAANYTNRSVYPMLHLLREESIDKALAFYKDPEQIPERNIHFAREKGLVYMKMLRDACL
jgi:uncharacterized protein